MPPMSVKTGKKRAPVLIDLALQGGGSHGAFTWGVLDRLLEEPWLHVEAISGTSAGAMNAAVLASGWTKGGAAGAREALDLYWDRVARAALFSPLQRTPIDAREATINAVNGIVIPPLRSSPTPPRKTDVDKRRVSSRSRLPAS